MTMTLAISTYFCAASNRGGPLGLWLAHDEQVVEPPQEEVPLLRGLTVVAHLQRLVVADDGDDVDRF